MEDQYDDSFLPYELVGMTEEEAERLHKEIGDVCNAGADRISEVVKALNVLSRSPAEAFLIGWGAGSAHEAVCARKAMILFPGVIPNTTPGVMN